ncbi:putative membrane protein [Photobacterium leiognathi lrivu.4.1]|uniref:Putative membrane protein n=1 Tax=Photobacterium leiognathi lrivu.4.1 TaxID=1248232 RepID=V5F621_PHOLE|nr:putative membrane protein [Photobacterium leiognathi lrivu.4.1]
MDKIKIVANVLIFELLIPMLITIVLALIIVECNYFGLTKYFYERTILFMIIFLVLGLYNIIRNKFLELKK